MLTTESIDLLLEIAIEQMREEPVSDIRAGAVLADSHGTVLGTGHSSRTLDGCKCAAGAYLAACSVSEKAVHSALSHAWREGLQQYWKGGSVVVYREDKLWLAFQGSHWHTRTFFAQSRRTLAGEGIRYMVTAPFPFAEAWDPDPNYTVVDLLDLRSMVHLLTG